MSSSLSRVRGRRAEIAKRLLAIAGEATALKAEDVDLGVTERTLQRLEAKPEEEMTPVSNDPLANKFSGERPSIKQLIIRTLKQSADAWMPDAMAVWAAIKRDYNVEINKNSFYPQIHSLVNDDELVVRDGSKLALAERLSRRELRDLAGRETKEAAE